MVLLKNSVIVVLMAVLYQLLICRQRQFVLILQMFLTKVGADPIVRIAPSHEEEDDVRGALGDGHRREFDACFHLWLGEMLSPSGRPIEGTPGTQGASCEEEVRFGRH